MVALINPSNPCPSDVNINGPWEVLQPRSVNYGHEGRKRNTNQKAVFQSMRVRELERSGLVKVLDRSRTASFSFLPTVPSPRFF